MLKRLFTSKVRVDLLAHFLLRPDGRFHARGLERALDAQYSAIWKELRNLEQAGVLISEADAGRKLFRLNSDFPLLKELRGMILKTAGAGDRIREALRGVGGIEAAFLFGSFAEGQADSYSDLDVMVIGEADLGGLSSAISEMESELGRTVNVMSYTVGEWKDRLRNREDLAVSVMRGPKLMLLGSEDALREIAETRSD